MQVHLRAGLRERARELEAVPLVLVTAPGGSGKSTLVRAWRDALHAAGGRMAWLSLSEAHRDPIVFVEDLVESVREVLPDPLEGADAFGLALLRSLPRSGEITPDPIVRLLERELRTLARPLVVSLDAFEYLDAQGTTVAIVDRLLRAAPRWLRLVVTTRGLQPKSAARLLAEGSAIEFSAEDLSLRTDQMRAVLEDAGVRLEESLAEQLLARTEGWAIAIRFAARALSRVPETERGRFIDDLVKQRDLFRYIATELIEGTAPELVSVLELASLLGPVDRETLVAALDGADAWERVERASQLGLLQGSPDRVALHDLLAEWLRRRFEARESPEAWRTLHARLGGLLEARGRDMDALRLYRSVRLTQAVARLLSRAAHGWVNRGLYDLAAEALAELPEALRQSDPALVAVAGIIEAGRDPDRAIENLKRAVEIYRSTGDQAAEFEALHELGIIAINENRMAEVVDLFRYALTLRRALLEPRLRGMVVLALADGSYVAGRYAFSLRLLGLADTYEHAPRERGGIGLVRTAILFHRGDWDRVVAEADERCADAQQRQHGPGFFTMQTRRCAVLGLRGIDVAGCRETLADASQMFTTARQTLNLLTCEMTHGHVALRAGDPHAAVVLFARAADLARRIRMDEAEAGCRGLLARAHQSAGEQSRAAEEATLAVDLLERRDTWASRFSTAPLWSAAAALGAVVYAEQVDPVRALAALDRKRRRLEHRELPLCAHAIRLCRARVAALAGDAAGSRKDLREAWRIHRQAGLQDVPPEVDRALLQWSLDSAREQGVETTRDARAGATTAALPPLRIESFGGLVVTRSGRVLSEREWRGGTVRRLLIRLLVEEGRPIARERIEADLWPEASASSARNSLRVALSRLRDVLEPRRRKSAPSRYVEVDGERVALTADALVDWDVRRWREAVAALEDASQAGDPAAAASALSTLEALRKQPFLPESFDDWSLDARRALDETWLRTGRRATAGWLERGEGALAERIARGLVQAIRDDEQAWLLLARARFEQGDRSGALRVVEEARAVLARELEIELGPDFEALAREIRGSD